MNKRYRDKTYSGWMGKMIGVVHGANIEGWTRETIESTFGEIRDYPFRFTNFCADDDINGPAFFQRAVLDYGAEAGQQEMADTFLNYVSDGHGFFWWGGYGVSTEHTAYQNLVEGVPPERSGSAELNGEVLANQIGGQIFSDCWGLACPGNPEKAAALAERMASLTHDQEGLQGARFIAAAIAAAFDAESVEEILDQAFAQLSPESAYAAMARDVRSFAEAHREDWRLCFDYVKEHYDYRFYQGVCHIIPNAAVIVLALVTGRGSFHDTINIAAMCGWDTDCNEGNLGTILGVYCGIEGIPKEWLPQIHDLVICSGSLGGLNIQTVPQLAETTLRAAKILEKTEGAEKAYQEKDPEAALWKRILGKPEGQYFHFQFLESTHGIRTRNLPDCPGLVRNTQECAFIGNRSLKIVHPVFGNSHWFDVCFRTYYGPEDFQDNRYQPDLSPVVYPGDTIRFHYCFGEENKGKKIRVQGYFVNRLDGKQRFVWERAVQIQDGGWKCSEIVIPSEENVLIQEVGVRITGMDVAVREQTAPFLLYLGDVEILSAPDYRVTGEGMLTEIWTAVDTNPAGFSYLRGVAEIYKKALRISGSGKPAEMYTGIINWKDYRLEAAMEPIAGEDHYLLARVQGGMRWYGAGFTVRDGKKYAAILKKNREISALCLIPFEWEWGKVYDCCFKVQGNRLTFLADGKELLDCEDREGFYGNGCVGLGNQRASRTAFREYSVKAL